MTDLKTEVIVRKSGESMIGAAGVLLAVTAVDSVVGGPADRATQRLSEGTNNSNREFFPYDTGVEVAASMLAGAFLVSTLIGKWRNRNQPIN